MTDLLKYGIKNSYIPEKMEDHTFLEIILDNNETAFLKEFDEWLILKEYCEDTNSSVENIRVRFRDHVELVAEEADGYFFTKGVGGWVGTEDAQENFFIIGKLYGDVVMKAWWKIPEITKTQTDRVPVEEMKNLIYGKAKV